MQQEAARGIYVSPTAGQWEEPEPHKAEGRRAEEQHARHRKRHAKRSDSDEPRVSSQYAAYSTHMHRASSRSSNLSGGKKATMLQAEALQQAEAAAMQQLPTKKERQKGFKELLRAWHPDKNPHNFEVA